MSKLGDYRANEGFKEWVAITPHDVNNIQYGGVDRPPDAIWVGTTGVIAAVDQRGTVVNFSSTVIGGYLLPISPRRVNATNTTATSMVALYY